MLIRADSTKIPLPDNSVHVAVLSPPYLEQRWYGDHPLEGGHEGSLEGYVAWLAAVFDELARVLKPDGLAWLNIGDKANGSGGAGGDWTRPDVRARRDPMGGAKRFLDTSYPDRSFLDVGGAVVRELLHRGWRLRSEITWDKGNRAPESLRHAGRPGLSSEKIYLLAPGPPPTYELDGTRRFTGRTPIRPRFFPSMLTEPGSVWRFPSGGSGPAHLAPFPDELARRCILPSTLPGDLVLDPFDGSGTTRRVAEELGRRGVGLDLYAGITRRKGRSLYGSSTPLEPSTSTLNTPQPQPEIDTTNLDPRPEVDPQPQEELYRVDGFYLGEKGFDTHPDGAGNHVVYANLTRADLVRKYASKDELDEWIATGRERRKTKKACADWWYTVERQERRLTYDPVSRTYLADVPPHQWDPERLEYVRLEEARA